MLIFSQGPTMHRPPAIPRSATAGLVSCGTTFLVDPRPGIDKTEYILKPESEKVATIVHPISRLLLLLAPDDCDACRTETPWNSPCRVSRHPFDPERTHVRRRAVNMSATVRNPRRAGAGWS